MTKIFTLKKKRGYSLNTEGTTKHPKTNCVLLNSNYKGNIFSQITQPSRNKRALNKPQIESEKKKRALYRHFFTSNACYLHFSL